MNAGTCPPFTISVIIPVYNSAGALDQCLAAVLRSEYPHFECIVVDDSSTDTSVDIAGRYPVRVLSLSDGPSGPAHARNCGAEEANGDILFFVDADVVITPNTIGQVAATFEHYPAIAATFGSYDEQPAERAFISQFKNLFHHFVHQQGREEAATFWSGCGAIRRSVFLEVGGFDAGRYPRPSIEDIELGYRLRAGGYTIRLNKQIQVKHLKRWTLLSLIKADILYRGIPWTQLIMEQRTLPDDLNLGRAQRLCALLVCLTLLSLGPLTVFHNIGILLLFMPLYLLVVGYWPFPAPASYATRLGRRTLTSIAVLLLGSAAVLVYQDNTGLLLFLIPAVLGVVGTPLLGQFEAYWSDALFVTSIFGFAGAVLVVLAILPAPIIAALLSVPLLVVLLNHGLYSFFARKRSVAFAVASIPFHFLYYLYSMISFVLGVSVHVYQLKTANLERVTPSKFPR